MKSKQASKRESKCLIPAYGGELKELIIKDEELKAKFLSQVSHAVSYTHLTLPTTPYV